MASSAVAETPSEKVFCEAWHYSAKHNRPVLGYSGGAESNLLLELLRPFQNVLTVRWVNAAALPHMAEYVRRRTRGWCFVELTSSPEGSFRAFGIPSTILPIDAVPVLRGDKHMPPDTPHLPPSGEALAAGCDHCRRRNGWLPTG